MKVTDSHMKILTNFSALNENFYYDGNFTLKTKNKTNDVFVECDCLDFIGIPFSYYDISQFLKFMKNSDFTIANEKIVIKNESGVVRFKLSNSDLIKNNVENKYSFDSILITKPVFEFNVSSSQLDELIRIGYQLDCDRVDIYSIDSNKICLFAYQDKKRDIKNYSSIIEIEHEHTNDVFTLILDRLKFAKATDYQFEIGLRVNQSNNEIPLTKIKAFLNDDIIVKYLLVMKSHKKEEIENDKE